MTDDQHRGDAGFAAGDPLRDVLLGFATQIDQLAALIGGGRTDSGAGAQVAGLLGEVGTLVTELGDLLARLITALIAVLEAVAKVLRSTPETGGPVATGFESIPVRIGSDAR